MVRKRGKQEATVQLGHLNRSMGSRQGQYGMIMGGIPGQIKKLAQFARNVKENRKKPGWKYAWYLWGIIMFGKKAKNEKPIVVTTKEELKAAIKNKKACIEVQGNLAKKMKWMTKLKPTLITALVPLLAASVVSGPVTIPAAIATTAAASGIAVTDITLMIALLSAGIMLAIIKGYNIELEADGKKIKLTKK